MNIMIILGFMLFQVFSNMCMENTNHNVLLAENEWTLLRQALEKGTPTTYKNEWTYNSNEPTKIEEIIIRQAIMQHILPEHIPAILTTRQSKKIDLLKEKLTYIIPENSNYDIVVKRCPLESIFVVDETRTPIVVLRNVLHYTKAPSKTKTEFENYIQTLKKELFTRIRVSSCTYMWPVWPVESEESTILTLETKIAIDPFLKIAKECITTYRFLHNYHELTDNDIFKICQNVLFFNSWYMIKTNHQHMVADPTKVSRIDQLLVNLTFIKNLHIKDICTSSFILLEHQNKKLNKLQSRIRSHFIQNVVKKEDLLPQVTLKEYSFEQNQKLLFAPCLTFILSFSMGEEFEERCDTFNDIQGYTIWPKQWQNIQATPCTRYCREKDILTTTTTIEVDKFLEIMESFDGSLI